MERNLFFVGFLKVTDEKSRIQMRILNPVYRSKDLDPSLNVTDPEHLKKERIFRKTEAVVEVSITTDVCTYVLAKMFHYETCNMC